ncbi:hypothetical protein PG995_005961 [Apiospora arundinis]
MALTSYTAQADERLLCTGDLSDVLVRCGDRSWQLHKLILSSRCMYFRAGLENVWLLGNPAYFYIDYPDVEAVSWIVMWIYTGRLPIELDAEDGSTFTACLRLIRCSRTFLLPELAAIAQQHLSDASEEMVVEAQTAFHAADDNDEQFGLSDLLGFFEGVQKAYEDEDLHPERHQFIRVVKDAHFWPVLDTTFKAKARDHPQFWMEIMALQQDAITDGAYWPYWKPEECHKCKKSPWQFQQAPRSTHWATLKLVKGRCLATCNYCAGVEENGKLVEGSKHSKNQEKGGKEKDEDPSSNEEDQASALADDDYNVSSDDGVIEDTHAASGELKGTKRQKAKIRDRMEDEHVKNRKEIE